MSHQPHFLSRTRRSAADALVVASTGVVIAERLEIAGDSASRTRGLLGRAVMPPNLALAIAPCWAIHTIGMRFPIDVLYVARDGRVLKTVAHLRAWRLSAAMGAFATIELAAGTIARVGVSTGDHVVLAPIARG